MNPEPQDESWRSFPQFERIFEPDQTEPFLRRVEGTCRQLQEISAKGSPLEKERAATALAAFQRSLALTKELGELRAKLGTTSPEPGR
jgi:hypothetical protein